MAAQLPDKKDLNVLKPGVPRSVVIAEMGAPSSYDELEGTRTEVYKFKQGYSTPNKISRAVFHGTADLFTWGLWEVVATPTEYCFSGTDTIVMVSYDGSNRVMCARLRWVAADPTEVYEVEQGSPAALLRAGFDHGTADLFTWGLREVVATPTEYCSAGPRRS